MADPDVRPATDDDAEPLARAYRSAYAENRVLGFPAKAESVTAEAVVEWIAKARVFVATVDGEAVGGVKLERTDPGRTKLSRLGVHEDWKGEGIGRRLLDRAEEFLGERGDDVVWLTTPEDHPYLPDLYRDRGYVVTEPYPLDYREYDEVVMEKRLDG